jgi:hypothetical protein
MDKVKKFYEKKGVFAFIIGRFIPFGVRNALFMSSGMSRLPFYQFVLWDAIACAAWSSICYPWQKYRHTLLSRKNCQFDYFLRFQCDGNCNHLV